MIVMTEYTVEREIEDLAAIIAEVGGGPVHLYGHSSGARARRSCTRSRTDWSIWRPPDRFRSWPARSTSPTQRC